MHILRLLHKKSSNVQEDKVQNWGAKSQYTSGELAEKHDSEILWFNAAQRGVYSWSN